MTTYSAAFIGCGHMTEPVVDDAQDDPTIARPYRHGETLRACDRLRIVACSSGRAGARQWVGSLNGIPPERQYADYRELIDRERPDLVVVGSQPEQRAERVVYAAGHGVRAIYAEKALSATMQEADAIVEAVERNGVAFNMGTQRRWDPGYDRVKEIVNGGDLGKLRTLISHHSGAVFEVDSHFFDLLMWLNNDRPALWVQGHVENAEDVFDNDAMREDPRANAIVQFDNGVTAFSLLSGRGEFELEAVCERGMVSVAGNGAAWTLRRFDGGPEHREPLSFEPASSTVRLVEDLVHSLDTGEPPRGGARVARASTELIFAVVESHLAGGWRVELPLKDCRLRLDRARPPKPQDFPALD